MGERINVGIDRATATHEEIAQAYSDYWAEHTVKQQTIYMWFKSRVKKVGYKSVAEFVRVNQIPVTAGTLTNYFRGNTMPLYMVKYMCYALRVTPNDFLTIIGQYDPEKQEIQELS
jgi:hypothetical protein